jgi:hypothetical protein
VTVPPGARPAARDGRGVREAGLAGDAVVRLGVGRVPARPAVGARWAGLFTAGRGVTLLQAARLVRDSPVKSAAACGGMVSRPAARRAVVVLGGVPGSPSAHLPTAAAAIAGAVCAAAATTAAPPPDTRSPIWSPARHASEPQLSEQQPKVPAPALPPERKELFLAAGSVASPMPGPPGSVHIVL